MVRQGFVELCQPSHFFAAPLGICAQLLGLLCQGLLFLGQSAETALEFLMAGAHAVQICSAVQQEDSSIVQDYISGLRALLYVNARGPEM